MLKDILSVIVVPVLGCGCYFMGRGLLWLGYGKKGSAALKELEEKKIGTGIFLAVLAFVWLLFGVFFYSVPAFRESGDSGIILGILIGCPVIYAVWLISARWQVPALCREVAQIAHLREADAGKRDLGVTAQHEPSDGDWQCTCGRVNAKYITSCPCGIKRKDILHK